jgi:hypothetical protein
MATRSTRRSGDRELIDTGTSKRYVRRDAHGRFTRDQVLVGRSLAADRRQTAATTAPKGQGDRGDRRPAGR